MPFLEHYITLPLIKESSKFLMLLVKSSIFWDNIKYPKHAINKALFKSPTRVLVRQIICS
jgi:hypothetical protein